MVYCLFYVTSKVIFFVFHVYFSPIITSLNLSWSCLHLFFSFKNEMREKNEFNHFPAVFLVCCSSFKAAENISESLKTTKPFYVIIIVLHCLMIYVLSIKRIHACLSMSRYCWNHLSLSMIHFYCQWIQFEVCIETSFRIF